MKLVEKYIPSTAASLSANSLALLSFDEFTFLVPGEDVLSLLPIQKIDAAVASNSCGLVEYNGHSVPVFSVNKALQLQSSKKDSHSVIAILNYQSMWFSLACNSLAKCEIGNLQLFRVPTCMSSRKQPFSQVAIVGDKAACLTNSAELWKLLHLRGAVGATISPTLIRAHEGY